MPFLPGPAEDRNRSWTVPFVLSKSRFQGLAFRCDEIVAIVTLLEAIEKMITLGNDKFPNLYGRLLHERKLKLRVAWIFREMYLRATT